MALITTDGLLMSSFSCLFRRDVLTLHMLMVSGSTVVECTSSLDKMLFNVPQIVDG